MKKIFTLLVILCFCGWVQAQGEHELIVEPTDVGVLDQTIIGDTTATGERNDLDRVYILRRGVPYIMNQTVRISDFHLRIRAEEGDGAKPILIFNAEDGGEVADQMFRINSGGHLTFENLHLAGQDILGRRVLDLSELVAIKPGLWLTIVYWTNLVKQLSD